MMGGKRHPIYRRINNSDNAIGVERIPAYLRTRRSRRNQCALLGRHEGGEPVVGLYLEGRIRERVASSDTRYAYHA